MIRLIIHVRGTNAHLIVFGGVLNNFLNYFTLKRNVFQLRFLEKLMCRPSVNPRTRLRTLFPPLTFVHLKKKKINKIK
jgi:hypothetical protein